MCGVRGRGVVRWPGRRPGSDLHAARAEGVEAGKEIAIIGFDDAPMSQYLFPSLTTVRQPIPEAGRKCVEILVSLMKGEEPTEPRALLLPELITRASA